MRRTLPTNPTFEPTPLRGDCAVVLGALPVLRICSVTPPLRLQHRTKDHGTQHAPSSSKLTTSADRRTVFGKMVPAWCAPIASLPARRLPPPHRFGRRCDAVKALRTPSRLDRVASPTGLLLLCGSRRARPQPPKRRKPCGNSPRRVATRRLTVNGLLIEGRQVVRAAHVGALCASRTTGRARGLNSSPAGSVLRTLAGALEGVAEGGW